MRATDQWELEKPLAMKATEAREHRSRGRRKTLPGHTDTNKQSSAVQGGYGMWSRVGY